MYKNNSLSRTQFILLTLLICLSSLSFKSHSEAEPKLIFSEYYYLNIDENADFRLPQTNRDSWTKRSFSGLPLEDKNFWVQVDYQFEETPQHPQGILVSLLGSYDAYWDGTFIGSNGQVGIDKISERPGKIDRVMLLPKDQLAPGTHTLSLRISSHYTSPDLTMSSFWAMITDYDEMVLIIFTRAALPMVMSSALLLIALYCLILYFSAYKLPSYLIFSALCFSILLLIFAESWRGLWGYNYDWQLPRLQIILALSCSVSILLTLFSAFFFNLKGLHRNLWLSISVIGQLTIVLLDDGWDDRSLYVFLVGLAVSVGICIQSLFNKQRNAGLMLLGLVLFTAPIAINTYAYMDQYFFLSFTALIALMLYTLTQTMRLKQHELIQSQLNASRLELELVKRNLQPHFILNTLTAVEEWIEDSPSTAVKFIQALADEFRYMAQMSAKSLISISDEVALCRSHLKVMGYRANIDFNIASEIASSNQMLPPGVILTLFENAISHNSYREGKITFTLNQTLKADRATLEFTAPANNHRAGKSLNTGTGSKYIEARLTESFAQQWKIQSDINEHEWQVTINLPLIKHEDEVMTQ